MKRSLLIICLLFFLLNTSYSQCGITGMQTQILQNSSFPIQNTSNSTLAVRVLNGNYPLTLGVQDSNSSGVNNAKVFSANESGSIVSSPTTSLGINEIEINNPGTGCVDTVEVEVVLVLPVEWLKPLSVKLENGNTILKFSTATETNNSHFEIQHSNSGRDFQTIGTIEGAGNSTLENNYEYLHEKPNEGSNYYRIKQVDFDGQYDYSNIAEVHHKPQTVSFYPNPTTNSINLSLTKANQVTVYSTLGHVLDRFELEAGEHEIGMKGYGRSLVLLEIGEVWYRVVVE